MLIFFCSRNNYMVLAEWLKRNSYDPDACCLVNFDVGSDEAAIQQGKKLCDAYNIVFEIADSPAIQACFLRAVELAKLRSFEWVIYQQQDTWAITHDFYSGLFNRLSKLGYRKEIGFVGVNVYHDVDDIVTLDAAATRWMTAARCFLQVGDGWYRRKLGNRADFGAFANKDFLSESIFWVIAACHVTTFDSVEVDESFEFILGFDDMIYQMLLKNKYQLVLSGLDIAHDQSMKEGTGIQKKSTVAPRIANKKVLW